MILPQTSLQSLILMIASLLCLGSWAITYKLTGKWRFELYYLDFAIGAVLAAAVYAATVGSLGFDGFSLTDDMSHSGKRQWMFAVLAGILFNLANMLLVAAISVAGMAVAVPVGLGLALIAGNGMRQLLRHQGDPMFLVLGLSMLLAGIVFVGIAYASVVRTRAQRVIREAREAGRKPLHVPRAPKGIILAMAGGLLMLVHSPLLARSREGEIGLGPYSATLLFTLGLFFSTLIFSIFFANLPVQGEPIEILDYFKGKLKAHLLGILGGILWATGMFAAAVATSVEEQARVGAGVVSAVTFGVPALAAFWGLLVFGEFREGSGWAKALAFLMLVLFAAGAAMVALAPAVVAPAVLPPARL